MAMVAVAQRLKPWFCGPAITGSVQWQGFHPLYLEGWFVDVLYIITSIASGVRARLLTRADRAERESYEGGVYAWVE